MNSEEQISLRSKGFTDAQIEEISIGMDQGLVVDVYAKKELMPQSMYQIRLGISQGFDMSMYATPQYDWFQLEEIRTGLEKGINVEKYHDPSIDSDKMQEMRLGLENHMDLSDFLKYSADIMREVRLCLLAAIDANDKAAAQKALVDATATIDKATSKGVYHKNTSSRKVSRMAQAVNKMA